MIELPTVPLGDLAVSLESGSRPKGGVGCLPDGIPSLGGEHINDSLGFKWDNPKHITREYYATLKRGRIQRGDILVVKDGATTGKTAIVRDGFPFHQAAVNEHVFILRTDRSRALPGYVAYFLFSANGQQQILSNFRGAAIGGIAQDFVRNVFVPLPSVPDQQRIVNLLDEADALRKLRTEADARTSALIPALFHDMFGDPAHNPRGWSKMRVKDVADLINGRAFKPSDWGTIGLPIIRIQNLNRTTAAFNHFSGTLEPKHRVTKGDILLSWAGQLVSFGVHIWDGPNGALNQHIFRVQPLVEIDKLFLQHALAHVVEKAKAHFHGIEMKHLTKGTIENSAIIVPPAAVQKQFAERVTELRVLETSQAESRTRLDDLFQSMLHQAFAGTL